MFTTAIITFEPPLRNLVAVFLAVVRGSEIVKSAVLSASVMANTAVFTPFTVCMASVSNAGSSPIIMLEEMILKSAIISISSSSAFVYLRSL